MPRAIKGQQKVPTLKKTKGFCFSRCYYSITVVLFTRFALINTVVLFTKYTELEPEVL